MTSGLNCVWTAGPFNDHPLACPGKTESFLYITGRRPDGYHNLQTLFQFLDYGDQLQITVDQSGSITLLTPVAGVADADNLIVRAANMLKQAAQDNHRLSAHAGAQIAVEKTCPWVAVSVAAPLMRQPYWWR